MSPTRMKAECKKEEPGTSGQERVWGNVPHGGNVALLPLGNAANYFKERGITGPVGTCLNWLHSIHGCFGTDLGKLTIPNKRLLPQSRVREF